MSLPRLWKALQGEKSPYIRGAFFVSLLTGARRDEVLTMKWTDLDLQQGIWSNSHHKIRSPSPAASPCPCHEGIAEAPTHG